MLCCLRTLGGRHGVARGLGRLIGVGEHQLAPGLAHVPFDVVGEHAQEDVRAHPVGLAVVDRAHLQVDRLERAKRPLDVGQRLVVAHAVGRIHLRRAQRGADDVDAVQRCLGGDGLELARTGERVLPDRQLEVLGHLVLVDDLAHAQADLVAADELARIHAGLDPV